MFPVGREKKFYRTMSDTAAESTQFRSPPEQDDNRSANESVRLSTSFQGPGNSLRSIRKSNRGGLAMRIAVPIISAVLIAFLVFVIIVYRRMSEIQLHDLKSDAANSVYLAGVMGRFFIVHRQKFLQDHPEYLARSEWLSGKHWLVEHGFVTEKDWVAATGFELNEYAPVPILEQAAERLLLADMQVWLDASTDISELMAVFILNANGNLISGSTGTSFFSDPVAIRSIPPVQEYRDAGLYRITVDLLDNVEPQPLVRGVSRIMSTFDPERQIGVAIVLMRTQRLNDDQYAFLLLALGVGALLALVLSLVCWLAAKRLTHPLRMLAGDMQAMAEGDFTRRSKLVDTDETGMLAQAFNSMAERLRVARANEKENSRLESDLAIARSIQNNLLPPQTPRVRGLDIHTSYRPAREIGGDYFDFLPVDSQHMGIVIADASGKSIPAALVMSTTRAILRFVAPGDNSAADTLTRANAILSVDIPKGMFVTAYYVILDPLNNSMLCASAGHTPLLIARKDGSVELMNPGGIALGFDNGPIFQRSIREQRVKLEQGDRVLLYTDGVVECVNPANEEYSDRRLREFLRRNRDLSSYDFIGALLADLDRHRGAADMRDDTTIVTFKVL